MWRRNAIVGTLVASLVALLAITATPASAGAVRECGSWGDHGDSQLRWGMSPVRGFGIYNVTTRNVGCSTARRFARRYKGTDSYYPTWKCRETNEYESSEVRCTRSGGRVIRWQTGS